MTTEQTYSSDFFDTQDKAMERIDEIAAISQTWANNTLARMETLAVQAEALLDILDGETYGPLAESITLHTSITEPEEPDDPSDAPAVVALSELGTVAAFDHTPGTYTELLKTDIKNKLATTIAGNLVIAEAVWDSIADRMLNQIADQQVDAEWRAANGGADLGWERPSESTLAALDEAQDEGGKKVTAAELEKFVQEAVQRREDLWNSIKEGHQLEQIWIGEHNTHQDRLLQTAIAKVKQAIDINNNIIAGDNLRVQMYLAQWEGINKRLISKAQLLSARVSSKQLLLGNSQARLAVEQARVGQEISEADGQQRYDLEAARIRAEQVVKVLADLSNTAAGMAQAALSASAVNVGATADYGYRWSYTDYHYTDDTP